MKQQNYDNHVQFYPAHHFVFYPVLMLCCGFSGYKAATSTDHQQEWLALVVVFLMIGWVSFMLRQHYALGNQNRLVRLEMRLRYFQLTNLRLETMEDKLSFGQIAALRFASDAELPGLVQRAITENLSADAIKKSIVNWLPDNMRV